MKLRSAKLGHFPQKKPIRRSNRRKTHALRCLFERWPRFRGVRSSINEAPLFSLFGAEIEKRELSRNSTLSLSLPHPLRSHPIPHFISDRTLLPPRTPFPIRCGVTHTHTVSSSFAPLHFLLVFTVSGFSDLLCFLLFKPSISYFIFFFQLALA